MGNRKYDNLFCDDASLCVNDYQCHTLLGPYIIHSLGGNLVQKDFSTECMTMPPNTCRVSKNSVVLYDTKIGTRKSIDDGFCGELKNNECRHKTGF